MYAYTLQVSPGTYSVPSDDPSSPEDTRADLAEDRGVPVLVSDFQSPSGVPIRLIELDPPLTPVSNSGTGGDLELSAQSLEALLCAHSQSVVDQAAEYTLSVDRSSGDKLWLSAMAFYKGALVRKEKLAKQLVVSFTETGELGADSGALRKEFFEDVLREANRRLFDGEDHNRIPKKDYTLKVTFELAGMLVAHSVLQDGPGLPCLTGAVYDFITKGECDPRKADIPLNLATTELLAFIDKVCNDYMHGHCMLYLCIYLYTV